ncbi:hypothetical protein [Azospirillum argentinense]|nr:hypothetical protein [Azospirillum argentinense]
MNGQYRVPAAFAPVKPTLPFVELMMARLLEQAPDRDAMRAALLAKLRKG